MTFLVFASLFALAAAINIASRKSAKKVAQDNMTFWEKERQANFTRKKSIEDLEYLSIPFEEFPMDAGKDDEALAGYLKELEELKGAKIVNLTGFTNTDLKLAYGTANITPLSEYDQNYTLMVRLLQDIAEALYEKGMEDEALTVAEYAIKTRTDISKTYYLAAEIYLARNDMKKMDHLIFVADTLQSAMKPAILRKLQEMRDSAL